MENLPAFVLAVLEVASLLFLFLLGSGFLALSYMYVSDRLQTSQTIRRNYPLIGRFRYLFEHLGGFFRQYFFAMDREELPFNRAQRSWVYRAAKNVDSTVAFGSTRPLNQAGEFIFLNGLFPPLEEEYQPITSICYGDGYAHQPYTTSRFFNVSAMSFGAISKPAIQALTAGAARAGVWVNTGEGGLSSYHLESGCDLVFQIGTAKYGVRDAQENLSDDKLRELSSHSQVKMFEIKLSQGAKPGKGGILPGLKVTEVIASTRGIPVGEDSISPNRHRDISCIDDLLEMIAHVREVTGKPVGFKVVIGASDWLDELCRAIKQKGLEYAPDFITVDGADGGTGAAPQSLIDFVGLQLRHSLPMLVNALVEHGLRERIKVICSGKMINPAGVAAALCLGADSVNSARGFMFALGCVQALQCNKNTCPSGVATHDKSLQNGLDPVNKATRVANYANNLHHEVEMIAHSCGLTEPRQLRREHLRVIA